MNQVTDKDVINFSNIKMRWVQKSDSNDINSEWTVASR